MADEPTELERIRDGFARLGRGVGVTAEQVRRAIKQLVRAASSTDTARRQAFLEVIQYSGSDCPPRPPMADEVPAADSKKQEPEAGGEELPALVTYPEWRPSRRSWPDDLWSGFSLCTWVLLTIAAAAKAWCWLSGLSIFS